MLKSKPFHQFETDYRDSIIASVTDLQENSNYLILRVFYNFLFIYNFKI